MCPATLGGGNGRLPPQPIRPTTYELLVKARRALELIAKLDADRDCHSDFADAFAKAQDIATAALK